ncbi:MAG: uroporphyrinogen decarboxylase [Elusimicrobia bacterium]|nr:uroporphyrinogen decarboxylase [Elusimicrobiota bacterium]
MRFLEACRRRRTDATPVWFMRQAGRYMPEYRRLREKYGLLELCERPALAAEAALQPVRAFEVDAAIVFADILLPVRPMGVGLRFAQGEGPALSPPVRTDKDVKALRVFDPQEDLGFVLEAVRLLRKELDGKVPVIGFAGAPFTVAAYLIEGRPSRDFRRTKMMMRGAPALWDRLMSKLAKVTSDYLKGQIRAGAQAVQLFESWAGALTRQEYVRHAAPYSREVLGALSGMGVPVLHFGAGTAPFLEDFRDADGDVVGVDEKIPLDEAWRRIGYGRAIQGNLAPQRMLLGRPQLKKAVVDILRRAEGRPGHIFNLGHGILPETPADNVRAVAEWVHERSS